MNVFLMMLCMSIPLCAVAMESEPRAITFYWSTKKWADEDEREHERNFIIAKAIDHASNKCDLNLNICNDKLSFYGSTSLLFEISKDDALVGIAKKLMDLGANPNLLTSMCHTPFERAIKKNAVRIAWHMLKHAADCQRGLLTLMDHACFTKDENLFKAQEALAIKMLKILRTQQVPINKIIDLHGQNLLCKITNIKRNTSGIIQTPEDFRERFATVLLQHGASPYQTDSDGEFALYKARKNGFMRLAVLLERKLFTDDHYSENHV